METPDIITVEGWSARFAKAFARLLDTEGGFVDDKADRGGATKYGISLRFLKAAGAFDDDGDLVADYDLDFDGDIDGRDIRLLTVGDARYLYLVHFWNALECDSFPEPIGEMLFDQGVNGGNAAARKLLQQGLNYNLSRTGHHLLTVDGKLGERTRKAIDKVLACPRLGMAALVEGYREAVRDRYRAIVRRDPSQRRFLRGWLRRADELGA